MSQFDMGDGMGDSMGDVMTTPSAGGVPIPGDNSDVAIWVPGTPGGLLVGVYNKLVYVPGLGYVYRQQTDDAIAQATLAAIRDAILGDLITAVHGISGGGGGGGAYTPAPFVSLAAVTGNQQGNPMTLTSPKSGGAMYVSYDPTVTGATLTLSRTPNGVDWYVLDTWIMGTSTGKILDFSNAATMGLRADLTGYAGSGHVTVTLVVS